MTTNVPEPGREIHYAPVSPHADIYIESPEGWMVDEAATSTKHLGPYIQRHFSRNFGNVAIKGFVYATTVFVPASNDDFCYVALDESEKPLGINFSPAPHGSQHYLESIQQRLGKAESLYPDLPIDIETEFVTPNLALRAQPGDFENERVLWDRVFELPRLVLVGAPGLGKTTCLRRIALQWLKSPEPTLSIPIYVQLRQFAEQGLESSSLRRILNNDLGASLADRFSDLCEEGRFVVLLDGLDEVPNRARRQTIEFIDHLKSSYPRLRIVVATRPCEIPEQLRDFWRLDLEPFSREQVHDWTLQKVQPHSEWRHFITSLNERHDVSDLLGNPLFLSFAVHLFKSEAQLMTTESLLRDYWAEILSRQWDKSRGVMPARLEAAYSERVERSPSPISSDIRLTDTLSEPRSARHAVREDWNAWLEEEKYELFWRVCHSLESSYNVQSVALNEAIELLDGGDVSQARQLAMLFLGLGSRLASLLVGVLEALQNNFRLIPGELNTAELDVANFRTKRSQQIARTNALLSRVVFSPRSRFFHKVHSLREITEGIEKDFRTYAVEVVEDLSTDSANVWEILEMVHYDLNTDVLEVMVLLKSFLIALPESEVGAFKLALHSVQKFPEDKTAPPPQKPGKRLATYKDILYG